LSTNTELVGAAADPYFPNLVSSNYNVEGADYAFYQTNFKNITWPFKCTGIALKFGSAFEGCKELDQIKFNDLSGDGCFDITRGSGFTTDRVFAGCEKLTKLVKMDNTDITIRIRYSREINATALISSNLFDGCKSLTYVKMAFETYSSIIPGVAINNEFNGCTNLTTIDCPGGYIVCNNSNDAVDSTSKNPGVVGHFRGCPNL